jgi:TM2 domain-containing membrane protein YozV
MAVETTTCPHCLAVQTIAGGPGVSEYKRFPVFMLAFFLGAFGVHRFFVGRITSGVFQLLTAGGLGIWWLADVIIIAFGGFNDSDGKKIVEWT